MSSGAKPLGSTYRIQLNGFGFSAALELVDYLDDLGIETLYLSPITTASSGSSHGYDVVDPTKIDPMLGTEEDFDALLDAVAQHRMRVLLDIVPNHMSTSRENQWWTDVLRLGQASDYSSFFDIDWEAGRGRVMLPVLERPLGEALDAGDLRIEASGDGSAGDVALWYKDRPFPLRPESDIDSFGTKPLVASQMADLLGAQHYRLADWKLAPFEINYRRFFDINDLVGVRVEDPKVYSATHTLILRLAADPRIAGVRVDHVDGLADPGAYLEWLQRDLNAVAAPDQRVVIVEKILARSERIPHSWAIDGTTGYEFADAAIAVLTDASGCSLIADQSARGSYDFEREATSARREAMEELFPGQVERLADEVARLARDELGRAEIPVRAFRNAIVALTECLSVYRIYTTPLNRIDADIEIVDSATALAQGLLSDKLSVDALWVLHTVVLGLEPDLDSRSRSRAWKQACIHWQQLSSPVAAKGIEDTALYRFPGVLSAADVGSNPAEPALTVSQFHESMLRRHTSGLAGLNATSTHDSKRSEDARTRLAVLSQTPDRWIELMVALRTVTGPLVSQIFPRGVIPAEVETSVYQSIVAIWPTSSPWDEELTERVVSCCIKAAREAKLRTSWSDPDKSFERAVQEFVPHVMDSSVSYDLLESFVQEIATAGTVNSLALVVMKTVAPGVPDFYQGTETWRYLLVDPDNRQPVDFQKLKRGLSTLQESRVLSATRRFEEDWPDGLLKMFLIRESLRTRREFPQLFADGAYLSLQAHGGHGDNIISFARCLDDAVALCIVPRLSVGISGPDRFPLGDQWGETGLFIPPDCGTRFRDAFTGNVVEVTGSSIRIADVLTALPVALLLRA